MKAKQQGEVGGAPDRVEHFPRGFADFPWKFAILTELTLRCLRPIDYSDLDGTTGSSFG